jgi:hypothetical protein
MPSDSSTSSGPVRILSRDLITSSDPSTYESIGIFRLGPLDQLVLTFVPVAVVYVYSAPPRTDDSRPTLPIESLKTATAKVLNTYPHLTGRLGQNPAHGGAHIHHLGSGAEILHAQCDQPLSHFCQDISKPTLLELPGMGEDLMAPYDFKSISDDEENIDQPVLTIQHTRFACGAVALGIRILHCLNDGVGFFQFVKDLAGVYRSLDRNQEEKVELGLGIAMPYLRDYELNTPEEDKEKARAHKSKVYYLASEPLKVWEQDQKDSEGKENQTLAAPDTPLPLPVPTNVAESKPEPAPIPTTGQILHFSPFTLSTLRRLASPIQEEEGGYITTFDAITSFLLQRIYQARHQVLDPSELDNGPLDLLCPIDLRHLLGLEEEKPYPYNAVFTTSSPFTPGELGHDDKLPLVAKKVHDMVRPFSSSSREEVKKEVEWISALQQHRPLIRHGYRGGPGSIMISQWNKMDMYTLGDFEGARPVLVAPPFTPISLHDGLGYLIPTAEGGGVDVYLALKRDVWPHLDISVQ